MAHCPYDQLTDLEDVLAVIRRWPDVKELKPGTFYVRRTPFLHFHLKGERRWADVRAGEDWGPSLDIPLRASARAKRAFLQALARCHRSTRDALGAVHGRSAGRRPSPPVEERNEHR
jgi:hypothetical protein